MVKMVKNKSKIDNWEFWQDRENIRKMTIIDSGAKSFSNYLESVFLANGIQVKNMEAVTGEFDSLVSSVSFEIGSVSFSLEIDIVSFSDIAFNALTRINIWSDDRGPLNRIYEVVKREKATNIPLNEGEVKEHFKAVYHKLCDIIENNQIRDQNLKVLISGINLPRLEQKDSFRRSLRP
jgi:hypothetical protein